jgi:tripartite-type tricarboxylate transporter receptor subunit TctC
VARDLAEAMRKRWAAAPISWSKTRPALAAPLVPPRLRAPRRTATRCCCSTSAWRQRPRCTARCGYKPLEDFEFLGMVNDVPMTLIGKPQLPANTYRDFENYIRANAGKLNIAHAGLGSASHTVQIDVAVSYQAVRSDDNDPIRRHGPAMNALVGGQVDVMCDQTTNTVGQIEGGRVKAFAVTTSKPLSGHKLLKDYPTLQEMGVKGFEPDHLARALCS